MNRSRVLCVLACAASVVFGIQSASAQAVAEVEGPISAVTAGAGGTGTMVVMGMTINLPAGVAISTPTATLTMAQLASTTPLPGRTQPGFIGGTAIVTGTVTPAGIITADEVFVEPAENVILGVITSNAPSQLTVNNTPVVFLTDARIPAGPPTNDLGFEVTLATIPVGSEASVEGYYDGTVFQAFLLEVTGVPAANPAPQISTLRAQGRLDKGELEVRGGLSGIDAAVQNVQISNASTNQVLGVIQVTQDPVAPGTAQFRFRARGITVPTVVRVTDLNNGATATAPVEIR